MEYFIVDALWRIKGRAREVRRKAGYDQVYMYIQVALIGLLTISITCYVQ